jgi:hypothetical protein
MAFVIKCQGCKQKIKWLVDDPPEDCPACGYRIASDRADDDVVMPNILSFATRCSDGVYKMLEKSSEDRVYAAAEQAGCDPSDMAGLKITNLRDNMKQGDIAAMPVVNDVTRQMDAIAQINPNSQFGFGGGAGAGLSFSSAVPSGPSPNAGARFQRAVNETHPAMVAQHCVGKDEHGHRVVPSTDVRSTRPANEMFNPGYRPRV